MIDFVLGMGLRYKMENLHAPTVPSGPTSGIGPDGLRTAGLSLAELQVKKDSMEAELKALSSVLDSVRCNEIRVYFARC